MSMDKNLNRIGIVGKARSGKDTLADYLCEELGYTRYAFGDEVKRHYHAIFGDTDVKPRRGYPCQGKPRRGYQWFGQAMRQHQPDIWIQKVLKKIEREQPERIVITDCRQQNEFDVLRDNGFFIVKIECDDEVRIERMKKLGDKFTADDLNHATEKAVDSFEPDIVIENNGTITDMIMRFKLFWTIANIRETFCSYL